MQKPQTPDEKRREKAGRGTSETNCPAARPNSATPETREVGCFVSAVPRHLLPDHVHMMIAIPPKYAVSLVIGFIKEKSAIHLARACGERKRNFVGQHFWARGYYVSTVGRDETVIWDYIRNQE